MKTILAAGGLLGLAVALRAQQPPASRRRLRRRQGSRLFLLRRARWPKTRIGYYGEYACRAVDQQLTKLAFSVDQDKTKRTPKEILVLSSLPERTRQSEYVTIIGEVVRFDPDEVAHKAKEHLPELPQPALDAYRGRPAILASSVITTGGVDLARRPPPPLTPAEEAFDKVMKQVGSANRAKRDRARRVERDGGAGKRRTAAAGVQAEHGILEDTARRRGHRLVAGRVEACRIH